MISSPDYNMWYSRSCFDAFMVLGLKEEYSEEDILLFTMLTGYKDRADILWFLEEQRRECSNKIKIGLVEYYNSQLRVIKTLEDLTEIIEDIYIERDIVIEDICTKRYIK